MHETFQVKRVSRNNGPTRRFYRCCRSTSVREATRGASPGLHAILPNTHIHLAKKHTPLKTIRYFFLAVVIETAICGCRHASCRCLTAVFFIVTSLHDAIGFCSECTAVSRPVPRHRVTISSRERERERKRKMSTWENGTSNRWIASFHSLLFLFFFLLLFLLFLVQTVVFFSSDDISTRLATTERRGLSSLVTSENSY